jgi:hypothetical protein
MSQEPKQSYWNAWYLLVLLLLVLQVWLYAWITQLFH